MNLNKYLLSEAALPNYIYNAQTIIPSNSLWAKYLNDARETVRHGKRWALQRLPWRSENWHWVYTSPCRCNRVFRLADWRYVSVAVSLCWKLQIYLDSNCNLSDFNEELGYIVDRTPSRITKGEKTTLTVRSNGGYRYVVIRKPGGGLYCRSL